MLAAVGVPLCALAAGAQISRAKNDKLEPTAVVDLHSYPCWFSSGEEKQNCAFSEGWEAQCGASNAQRLSTRKDLPVPGISTCVGGVGQNDFHRSLPTLTLTMIL